MRLHLFARQPSVQPGRIILVLNLQRRQPVTPIQLFQFTQHQVPGQAVGNNMMHVDEQHILLLSGLQQANSQQRSFLQVKGKDEGGDLPLNFLPCRAKHLNGFHPAVRPGMNLLYKFTVHDVK
ncbi:hypothetical protein D1872_286350 [compost metagenome]